MTMKKRPRISPQVRAARRALVEAAESMDHGGHTRRRLYAAAIEYARVLRVAAFTIPPNTFKFSESSISPSTGESGEGTR